MCAEWQVPAAGKKPPKFDAYQTSEVMASHGRTSAWNVLDVDLPQRFFGRLKKRTVEDHWSLQFRLLPVQAWEVGAHLNLDMSRCRFGCFPLRSDALCKGMTWFLFAWCQISLLDYFQAGTCQQLVKDQKFIRKKERWFSFFLPLLTGVSYILLFPWIFLHSFCIFKVWTRGTRKQMDRGRVLRERWWKTRHEWNEVAWNMISWQVYFPDVYSTIKLCVRFNFCSLMLLTVLACCPARGLLMTFQEALSSACHGFVLKRLSVLTWLFNFWLKVLSAFSCMISLYCRGSR